MISVMSGSDASLSVQPGMMAVLANRSRLERELGGAAERISSIRKAREEAGVTTRRRERATAA